MNDAVYINKERKREMNFLDVCKVLVQLTVGNSQFLVWVLEFLMGKLCSNFNLLLLVLNCLRRYCYVKFIILLLYLFARIGC